MHATCLHCTKPLGANEVLETLPIGRRIAFDAAQGRLWVVCRHCARWNLVPFDTRLESIDAAERLFRDTRTRYSTDNIGLARVPEGLELVRIGPALRPEFAAWRYGESYRRRRRKAIIGTTVATGGVISLVGAFGAGFATAGAGAGAFALASFMMQLGERLTKRGLRITIPSTENHSVARIGPDHWPFTTMVWRNDDIELDVVESATFHAHRVHTYRGDRLRTVGRRVVAAINMYAGSTKQLTAAADILAAHCGDLRPFLQDVATGTIGAGRGTRYPGLDAPQHWREYPGPYLKLAELPPAQLLALEMWLSEDLERTWLEGELKLLEREWREADRLAAITDGLALEGAGVESSTRR